MEPLSFISAFVDSLTWSSIPSAAQQRAHAAFRDTVGAILGGSSTPAARVGAAVAGSHGNSGPMLAFATAVKASALDIDDGHYLGGAIHPGSVVVSALLVAAQELIGAGSGVTSESLLCAQVAGYEIALRAAHLLWPRHELDRYHCTGTAATLGAAAAVARLRGYDADTIERSIAIAWAHAPMSTFQLPMVKESIGWSAASAYFAADLAGGGFMKLEAPSNSTIAATFPPTPFDLPGVMTDPFVASLGSVFECAHTYFKPFAACRYTHTAARSLQELIVAHNVAANEIVRIDVGTHRGAMNLTDQRPASLDHAQYSFPFVLATTALTGNAGGAEMQHEAISLPDRLELAERVFVHHDPSFDDCYPRHYGTRIDITLQTGAILTQTRLVAPGDLEDPLSPEDLEAKFLTLATPALGETGAATLASELQESSFSVRTILSHVFS